MKKLCIVSKTSMALDRSAIEQCDQIGLFIGLCGLWQQLICPNLPHFCKGVEIYHFSSEIIFGQFFRPLAIFFWSHSYWATRPTPSQKICSWGNLTEWEFEFSFCSRHFVIATESNFYDFIFSTDRTLPIQYRLKFLLVQRALTKGEVRLTSCLTGLDFTKQIKLLFIQHKQSS